MRPLSLRKRSEQAERDGAQEPEALATGGDDEWGRGREASEWYRHSVLSRLADDVTTYVLDERLEITPAGVEGRLFVGGPVTHAADAAPDATAVLFLPNPFSPEPGARIYRTGVRARLMPDYTGVRSRWTHGYRIEIVGDGGPRAGD